MASILIKEGPARGQRLDVESEVVLGRLDADVTIAEDDQLSRQHARLKPVEGALEIEDLGSLNGTWVNGDRIPGPTRLDAGDLVQVGATVIEVIEVTVRPPVPEAVQEQAPRLRDTLVGEPAGFVRPTFVVEPSTPAEPELPPEPVPAAEPFPPTPVEEPLPEPVFAEAEEAGEPPPPEPEPEEAVVEEPALDPIAVARAQALAASNLPVPQPEPAPPVDAQEPEHALVPVIMGRSGALDGYSVAVEDEVVLGREGDIVVDDPEVSRQHALVYREGDAAVIRDLGSLNGTWIAGERIAAPMTLGPGVVVTMGTSTFEVVLEPAPSEAPRDAG